MWSPLKVYIIVLAHRDIVMWYYVPFSLTGQRIICTQLSTTECLGNISTSMSSGDTSDSFVDILLPSFQLLSTNFRLTCSGYVTGWGTLIGGAGEIIIEFQIWRENRTDTFEKIGGNRFLFRSQSARSRSVTFGVAEESMINVQEGDVVGLYIGGLDDSGLIIIDNITASVHVLFNVSEPSSKISVDNSFPGVIENFSPGIGFTVEQRSVGKY